jgi:hypothetical protein
MTTESSPHRNLGPNICGCRTPQHAQLARLSPIIYLFILFQPQRVQQGQLTLSQSADKTSKYHVGFAPLQNGRVPLN